MKFCKYILFGGFAMLSAVASAQYFNDALIFSQTTHTIGSSARMQGIGGAQISLGADISSATSNPAGLGFFNKSVISFTPSMNFHTTNSSYAGSVFPSYRNNFNIANVGIVLNANKGNYTDEKFKAGSFAISYSRTNDFNSDFFFQGRTGGSVVDIQIDEAGLTPERVWETDNYDRTQDLAASGYFNYLINPVYDADTLIGYDSYVLGTPVRSESIRTSGSQSQLNFAWGGNYDDKIYFGGGIGFTTVNYSIDTVYREELFLYQDNQGNDQTDDWIDHTQIRDELTVSGGGINATIGMIIRPVNFVTLGASYMTPTYYSLEDESGFVQTTRWNNVELDNGDVLNDLSFPSDIYINQYNLKTPGKINLGATVFLGKAGFITGDLQFVDYTSSQLRSSDFSVVEDNNRIKELYRDVVNFNVGGEFRLENFRFRGGYAHFGDPYNDGDFFDESRRNLSFGVGYRTRDYFVDLAFVNSKMNELFDTYFFFDGAANTADVEKITNTVSATVGFNF